jgi:plasmid replication initiation protein
MDVGESKVLIKHSASIQITNDISFLARRISNVLLANARRMPPQTRMFEIPLSELRRGIEYGSKNISHLKEAIKSLAATVVEYNIFDKDKGNEWGVFSLLSQVKIKDSCVLYWYPPDIQDMLMSPNVYAQLDLAIQNKFTSKHSLALWEYLTDALGSKRLEANIILQIADFRKLMSLDPDEYQEFCDLNKRVIQPSVREINAHAKLSVELEIKRKARTPVALIFGVWRMKSMVALIDEGQGGQINQERLALSNEPATLNQVSQFIASETDNQDKLIQVGKRDQLQDRLIKEFGLKPEAAQKVLAEYSENYISDNLDVVKRIVQKGSVRNVAAYTIGALKADYRPKPGQLDKTKAKARGIGEAEGNGRSSKDEARIEMARQWYERLDKSRQDRVKDLFVASLNVIQINPIREFFRKEGFNHPKVVRAFMLHVAQNLEKKQVEVADSLS